MRLLITLVGLMILGALVTLTPKCTRAMARSGGGTETVALTKGQKLINVTWKGDSLWYVTRPMKETDVVESYTFHEDSAYGILQGTIIINEQR